MEPIDEYYEEDLDEYLLAQGVTQEELDRDLGHSLTINGRYGYSDNANIRIGKSTITVSAGDICSVLNKWKDDMDPDTLKAHLEGNKEEIGQLLRHPGGYHEWLEIQALETLMLMNIPAELIKAHRPLTSQCTWYSKERGVNGRHGKNDSGNMHIDLVVSINNAYNDCILSQNLESAPKYLANRLREFNEKYQFGLECQSTLTNLINELDCL